MGYPELTFNMLPYVCMTIEEWFSRLPTGCVVEKITDFTLYCKTTNEMYFYKDSIDETKKEI